MLMTEPQPMRKSKKICDYPDRRMKALIFTMFCCGIRLGAWDYLQWRHIIPIENDGKIIAAKIKVYAGTEDEYFSFITPEAYFELEKWITLEEQPLLGYPNNNIGALLRNIGK